MTNTNSNPASNSDVLKRFGRRVIMWRAHGIWKRREWGVFSFSDALKRAWRSLRAQIDREREAVAKRARRKELFGFSDFGPRFGRGSYNYMTSVMGA